MHTFKAKSTTFNHNGGFEGDVDLDGEIADRYPAQRTVIRVPMKDLIAFVAEYVRRERISRLENATDDDLLGLPRG